VTRVDSEPVGDVHQRVRGLREQPSFVEPERWPHVPLPAKRRAGRAERPGDDEQVAGLRSAASRHAGAMAERGHTDHKCVGRGGVPADDGHAGLGDPLVEGNDIRRERRARGRERDQQRLRLRPGGGEVAEVDGGRPPAQVAPADPVEPEVDLFDERVLRHDEIAAQLRRVVGNADDQFATLELRQEPDLTEF